MEAAISGRAGVALIWEEESLFSLHLGMAPNEAVPRREWEIPHLLGAANDLRTSKGADRAHVAKELEVESRCVDTLHLALMTLDPGVDEDLREEAAIELEKVLNEDPRYVDFVENVLYSNPLPAAGDLPGALRSAKGTKKTFRLFAEFDRLQPQIAEVWIAWQGIGDDQFIHPEDRQRALAVAVRSGGFRRLASMLDRGERVDNFLVDALSDPEVRAFPGFRTIWLQWVKPLREESRYPEHREERWQVAEPGPELHDDRRRSFDRIQAKENVDR